MNAANPPHADLAIQRPGTSEQAAMVIDTTANILGADLPTSRSAARPAFGGHLRRLQPWASTALRAFSTALSRLAGDRHRATVRSARPCATRRLPAPPGRLEVPGRQGAPRSPDRPGRSDRSAQLRIADRSAEPDNQEQQIDHIQKQIDFLRNKFTDQELYDWQVGQLADTYFQSYKLAYDVQTGRALLPVRARTRHATSSSSATGTACGRVCSRVRRSTTICAACRRRISMRTSARFELIALRLAGGDRPRRSSTTPR